jgi:hypothetical protein
VTNVTRIRPAVPQDPPCPDLEQSAKLLIASGKTPEDVWAWDPYRHDPDRRDPACLILAEQMAYILGEASPLEAYLCETGTAALLAISP